MKRLFFILLFMVLAMLAFAAPAFAQDAGGDAAGVVLPELDAVTGGMVVILIGLAKTVERIVTKASGKSLPEGTWATAHLTLVAVLTLLGVVTNLFGVPLNLGGAFSTVTNVAEGLNDFLLLGITSGAIYFILKVLKFPLLGWSKPAEKKLDRNAVLR